VPLIRFACEAMLTLAGLGRESAVAPQRYSTATGGQFIFFSSAPDLNCASGSNSTAQRRKEPVCVLPLVQLKLVPEDARNVSQQWSPKILKGHPDGHRGLAAVIRTLKQHAPHRL
jgi:hypothetical protein